MVDNKIITKKEARKILGKVGANLSDTDIQQLVDSLTVISKLSLRFTKVPKNKVV